MNKRTLCNLFAASVLACAVSASQAAVVEYWSYSIDMEWTAAVFDSSPNKISYAYIGSTPYYGTASKKGAIWGLQGNSSVQPSWTGTGATTLSWGSENGTDGAILGYNPNGSRSSLTITQPHGEGWIKSGGSVNMVNMFTHTNNEITADFHHLQEATLKVSVDLRDYFNDALPIETLTKDFKIFFYETPNVGGTCPWGNCNDDLFAFVAMPTIYDTFTYDGQTYQFNYFQTSGPNAIMQFDADVCSAISGGKMTTSCYGFKTQESAQTTLQFGISVTAVPVPEPETYAMLLTGLGIVGFVVRRRRSTIHR